MKDDLLGLLTSTRNAEYLNRCEVRSIISTAEKRTKGVFVIRDRSGRHIYVDTLSGMTGLVINVVDAKGETQESIRWYAEGSRSKKDNGYVYTVIDTLDERGRIKTIRYGTHSLVCMLANTEGYDRLSKGGMTPVCNHMDNMKWNNKASNLEWVTQSENLLHAKLIYSLDKAFPGVYTSKVENLSDNLFTVLKKPLSVSSIREYIKDPKHERMIACGNKEYINREALKYTVDWLKEANLW